MTKWAAIEKSRVDDGYGDYMTIDTFKPFKDEAEMQQYAERNHSVRIIQYVDAKITTTVSVKVEL